MIRHSHSCDSATQTLAWINAIVDFLKPFKPLLDAHVVNFFKDRLWESVDKQWIDCLREESLDTLLQIPSGVVQDYWPASLQEFIITLRSLTLPREPGKLQLMLPELHVASLGSVLSQGMTMKKKHEVEILAAVVSAIAHGVEAQTIIDIGAGQGYLAQVLSFEYQLSVIAIDASSHHGSVTRARAERIKKHYAAKLNVAGGKNLIVPRAVTCHVLSSDSLKAINATVFRKSKAESSREIEEKGVRPPSYEGSDTSDNQRDISSLVLAGLHACGDLSVTILKTFLDCKEAKALVSIGCCYNLLSEESSSNTGYQLGFPMSNGAKLSGLSLGKKARDLACQSAERWRSLTKEAALQNFQIHSFRAAFQMVLCEYYPEALATRTSPSIGRQGKAFRRKQMKKIVQESFKVVETKIDPYVTGKEETLPMTKSGELSLADEQEQDVVTKGDAEENERSDRCSAFEDFCKSGLSRLGLRPPDGNAYLKIWKEAQPFSGLVGPFWSIRAALGPLVETLILLDRLLFLQEDGGLLEAAMVPIFDPSLSPRNVAIIARKL